MKTAKAGITGLSPTEKVAKALLVETKLTGNLDFATPVPSIATLTTAREKLEDAITEAAGGDHAKVYAKNIAVADVDDLLVRLALYVSNTAAGDVVKILSTGFEPRKPSDPIGPLTAPLDLLARASDKPGEMEVRWSPVNGARYYQVYINGDDPDDATKWELFDMGSKASFLATGLVPGKAYWFRVLALGTAGPGPVSDPAKGYAANNP